MDTRSPISPALQAAFEAIQAKHHNFHACFATKGNSLLLELADMILLLSAQLTLLETRKGEPAQQSEADDASIHLMANPSGKAKEYSQCLGFSKEV